MESLREGEEVHACLITVWREYPFYGEAWMLGSYAGRVGQVFGSLRLAGLPYMPNKMKAKKGRHKLLCSISRKYTLSIDQRVLIAKKKRKLICLGLGKQIFWGFSIREQRKLERISFNYYYYYLLFIF
jgi:hypothetical protein